MALSHEGTDLARFSNINNGMFVSGGTPSLFGAFTMQDGGSGSINKKEEDEGLPVLGYARSVPVGRSVKNLFSVSSTLGGDPAEIAEKKKQKNQKKSASSDNSDRGFDAADASGDMAELLEMHSRQELLSDKPRYIRKNKKRGNRGVQPPKRGHRAEDPKPRDKSLHTVSFWHHASQNVVNAIADIESEWMQTVRNGKSKKMQRASPINVAHGIVLLEVVDVKNAQIRRVVLGKTPGLGNVGLARGSDSGGGGTGGDLTGRNLLLTDAQKSRDAANNVSRLGMPACIGACELDSGDGRLALLFADGHVRLLELRLEKLLMEEQLYRGLSGLIDAPDDSEDGDMDSDGGHQSRRSGESSKKGKMGGRFVRKGNGRGRGSGKGEGNGRRIGGRGNDAAGERNRLAAERSASEALRKARELVAQASSGARAKLDLDELEESTYDELYASVENEISQLRVVLEAVEAKEKERVWLRGKTSGEMDDSRLVDLAIGEKNVYKKRGKKEASRLVQRLPKRLSFVVDVSGSMAYFNR